MKPAPRQRWKFNDSETRYFIAEIISAASEKVMCRVLQTFNDYNSYPVGYDLNSSGLYAIYNGGTDHRWTYLEGQDAPGK
jgi:hypothetical protein